MQKQVTQTRENTTVAASNDLAEKSTGNRSSFVLQDNRSQSVLQKKQMPEAPVQKKENKTGLPDQLKTGIENLSGHSMDDVKVPPAPVVVP